MWEYKAIENLSNEESYSREELFNIFSKVNNNLTKSTFGWVLYNLLDNKKLYRVNRDFYVTQKPICLPSYKPLYSDKAKQVLDNLVHLYPKLSFVLFESNLLNEFLNHQIAQNTIYVQVEKDVSSFIFEELREEYKGNILYNPNANDFERYWTKDSIVVLNLTSQSPMKVSNPHEISIEKMLVDILSEKSIEMTFSLGELPTLFNNAIDSYSIEISKMYRYATRRNKLKEIKLLTRKK